MTDMMHCTAWYGAVVLCHSIMRMLGSDTAGSLEAALCTWYRPSDQSNTVAQATACTWMAGMRSHLNSLNVHVDSRDVCIWKAGSTSPALCSCRCPEESESHSSCMAHLELVPQLLDTPACGAAQGDTNASVTKWHCIWQVFCASAEDNKLRKHKLALTDTACFSTNERCRVDCKSATQAGVAQQPQ